MRTTYIPQPAHNKTFLVLVLLLTVAGLIIIGSASVVAADRDFGDKWFYLRQQVIWACLGLTGMFITSRFPIQLIEKHAFRIYSGVLVLLILVAIPGVGTSLLGARRWITFGNFSLQPGELAKLGIIIYLAALLKTQSDFKKFIFPTLGFAGLIMLQPDMGTTMVVVGIAFYMYFASGASLKPLLKFIPLGLIMLVLAIAIAPYRLNRVKTFLDTNHDPQGQSYQVRQAIIGLGSGGIFGSGLGQSRQKYEFLPEVTTDSIYAVVGEELGLIGASILLLLYLSLALSGIQVARYTKDSFSSFLAVGISCWFGMQAFINISAVVALVPFTGIPLTFVSYGGTALFVNLVASGLLVNIAKSHS